jgi:hypothetical protein
MQFYMLRRKIPLHTASRTLAPLTRKKLMLCRILALAVAEVLPALQP